MELYLSAPSNITNPHVIVSRASPSPSPAKDYCYLPTKFQPRLAVSGHRRRSTAVVVAGASNYSSGYCEFSSLNTPIEPKTQAGRFLSAVLLNDRKGFHGAVAATLEKLVEELDEAHARRALTADSTEACLHRRIAELKSRECQTAVEDVMYMIILYKFSEIRVHLIPPLSKCIYNSRLEILPSKDWELESIHSVEVLDLVKQHLTRVTGWRPDFNVTENWATTKTTRLSLCRTYSASVLFGYFLKSAALRHRLEMGLVGPVYRAVFGRVSIGLRQTNKRERLGSYLMGFSPETLVKCAQPNSKEALNLIVKHSFALFGGESDETISTSFASLKRFVFEGVAFGSFLWDTEEYVKTVYDLEETK